MKIFSAAQIKACDNYTIHASSITSTALMERAAEKCTEWLLQRLPHNSLYIVLCGTGNNGGDGLAITRMLHQNGIGAKAFVLQLSQSMSPDCQHNYQQLQHIDSTLVEVVPPDTFITDIPPHIIIIDAILGIGLNRPAEGWVAKFIDHINQLPNLKIAIDIPSGLPADSIPEKEATIVQADHTLSFQFYKRTLLHPETGPYAGLVHILDIGLSETFIRSTHSIYQVIDKELIYNFFQPRMPFTHKGTFGTALLVGGSYGMMGAICLSAQAALRAGAGKVRGLIPICGYSIFQTLAPEAMCVTNGDNAVQHIRNWEDAQAIGIGPGMGTSEKTAQALETFLEICKEPLVLDADALNIIGKKPELLHLLPAGSILTPHPKEFERIFGATTNSMMRLEHARAQAMKYNITLVMKDRHTVIVTPEGDCWYNLTGNAGLATGGTGDVLTGIITGLLAQGYEPQQAAILGIYLHGLSAEMALEHQSMESMTAGDIVEHLGKAFKTLYL